MKKQLLLFLSLFLVVSTAAAQESPWEFGLSVGGTITRLDAQSSSIFLNDLDNGLHPNIAIRTGYRFSKGFGLTALPGFSITGFSLTSTAVNFLGNIQFEDPLVFQTDLDLTYFRVPVLASWYLGKQKTEGKGFSLSVGLYAGVKISESLSQRVSTGNDTDNVGRFISFRFEELDTFDSGTIFELRRLQPLWGKNFSFELRSVSGFSNIDGTSGQDGLRTASITFGIGYMF